MKRPRTQTYIYVIPLIVVVAGAAVIFQYQERKETQEQEAKFIATFVELSIAQKMFRQLPERYDSARNEILARNGFSRTDLSALEEAYKDEPERWLRIWQEIVTRLEQQQDERRKKPLQTRKPPPKERIVEP